MHNSTQCAWTCEATHDSASARLKPAGEAGFLWQLLADCGSRKYTGIRNLRIATKNNQGLKPRNKAGKSYICTLWSNNIYMPRV